MGFSFEVTGLNEMIQKMDKLGEKAQGIASEALYEGAGVMADQVSQAVHGIATKRFKYPAPPGKTRMPSPEEKALVESAKHGVARFKKNGLSVQTSVGFQNSGYGTLTGKTVPIPKIANAINSGTSFMNKQPFFRKAVSTGKGAATARIEAEIKKRIDELDIG